MLGHMKKRPTKKKITQIRMHHRGAVYQFPIKVAEKYRITSDKINSDALFSEINKKYTKPGALLKGIRYREGLTQAQIAKKLNMTQSDISQMENGIRRIGREVAKRIEGLFHFDYREFLE